MKALNAVLVVVGLFISSASFATECMAGFADKVMFGELVALELNFGARLVPNNSKCSESFKVIYSNIIEASCQVCGQLPAVGDQVIGKRKVLKKGVVRTEPAYTQWNSSPNYAYDIHLQEMTPGNPLVLRCVGDVVRGYDYNITNNKSASMVLAALAGASVACAKPKVRASCF